MTLGIQVHLLVSWHENVQYCYEVHAYVTQRSTSCLKCTQIASSCTLKCKHMALAISALKNIFPLDTETQDNHVKYPNVLLRMLIYFLVKEVAYVDKWNPLDN